MGCEDKREDAVGGLPAVAERTFTWDKLTGIPSSPE